MSLLLMGFLCATAGFLIICASVVFVIKGKAVLNDLGAPNTVEWGKLKANLTSALSLFVLGAAMVGFPFWSFQRAEDEHRKRLDGLPVLAHLTQKITMPKLKNLRLLIVAKPDYDQNYGGQFTMDVPLIPTKLNYSVLYLLNNEILYEQPFSILDPVGASKSRQTLPPLDIQLAKSGAQAVTAQELPPG